MEPSLSGGSPQTSPPNLFTKDAAQTVLIVVHHHYVVYQLLHLLVQIVYQMV